MTLRTYILMSLSVFWLSTSFASAGDHLKKIFPPRGKPLPRIVAMPPCVEEGSIESTETTDPISENDPSSSSDPLSSSDTAIAALPPDSSIAASSTRMDMSGLNADRSSYESLQTLSSIGDFFAPDGQSVLMSGVNLGSGQTFTGVFDDQPLAPGAGIGRFKTSDSNSPIPRDRLFLDYSLFRNARLTPDDIDVQRFVPGLERTFIDGLTSLELRLPIAMTLNSNTFTDSNAVDRQNTEFGNIAIAAKGVLWSTDGFVLTSGAILQTPTADDIVFGNGSGVEAIRIENNQYRILPFLATLHHNDQWFWQNYAQLDLATNGNKVFINNDGQQFDQIGVLQEQNYLYLDTSLSRWLHRNYRRQTGVAMTLEFHYNSTIGDSDTVRINDNRGTVQMGSQDFSADIVNMNIGPTFLYGATTVTVAYGTPLTDDRGADSELRVLLNRLF